MKKIESNNESNNESNPVQPITSVEEPQALLAAHEEISADEVNNAPIKDNMNEELNLPCGKK